jgi:hypothetical protein
VTIFAETWGSGWFVFTTVMPIVFWLFAAVAAVGAIMRKHTLRWLIPAIVPVGYGLCIIARARSDALEPWSAVRFLIPAVLALFSAAMIIARRLRKHRAEPKCLTSR